MQFTSIVCWSATLLVITMPRVYATDWLTTPTRFSHDPATGQRVAQYATPEPAITTAPPPIRSSGYTHTRSSLNYGQSADNYHRVERWGDPVRPYGEWRFPNRPYSAPYPAWGPPYGGLNIGLGGRGIGGIAPGLTGVNGFGYPPGYGRGTNPNGGGIGGDGRLRRTPTTAVVPPGQTLPWPYPRPSIDPTFPSDRRRQVGPAVLPVDPLTPYPSGPATPYPVAPYYDGYHPVYRD